MKTKAVVECADSIEWLKAQPSNSVDLIIGSPPYALKTARYPGARRKMTVHEWIDWMCEATVQSSRVSRGFVVWIANGCVRNSRYHPACEGLVWKMYDIYQMFIIGERSCIWHKNAPPQRNGKWFSNDWEFIMAFYRANKAPHFDPNAIAHAPKFTNGGDFNQRTANGSRRKGSSYPQNKLAMPRDVIRALVGGGHMGSKIAHENEAPYPEELIRPFIKACCPPGGIVADCFSGSGTTAAVAIQEGRSFVGCDVRQDQVELTMRRIEEARKQRQPEPCDAP